LFCRIARIGFERLFCVVCGYERCVEALRLEAAEFLERPVEGALGGGAGTVDRGLERIQFFVRQVLRWSDFERGATTDTPCGMDDFPRQGLLERPAGASSAM